MLSPNAETHPGTLLPTRPCSSGVNIGPTPPPHWAPPPPTGKRRFPSATHPTLRGDQIELRPRRRLFPTLCSEELEMQLTPSERRHRALLLSTVPTEKLRPVDELLFLSHQRHTWKLGGARIPSLDDEPTPRLVAVHTPQPVKEVSSRLLRELKREAPRPIQRIHDGKTVDASKLAERLYSDSERREKKRQEAFAALQRAETTKRQQFKKMSSEDLQEQLAHLVDEALTARRNEERKLLARFVPEPPSRKLGRTAQEEQSKRLYRDGTERLRAATARAVRKYIDDAKPVFPKLTPEQIQLSAARLSTPRSVAGTTAAAL